MVVGITYISLKLRADQKKPGDVRFPIIIVLFIRDKFLVSCPKSLSLTTFIAKKTYCRGLINIAGPCNILPEPAM